MSCDLLSKEELRAMAYRAGGVLDYDTPATRDRRALLRHIVALQRELAEQDLTLERQGVRVFDGCLREADMMRERDEARDELERTTAERDSDRVAHAVVLSIMKESLQQVASHYRAWQAAEQVGAEVDADQALSDLDEAIAALPLSEGEGT